MCEIRCQKMARTTPVLFPGRRKDFTVPVLPSVGGREGENGEGRSRLISDPVAGFTSAERTRRDRLSCPEAPTPDLASTPFVSLVATQLLSQLRKPCDLAREFK